MTTNKEVDEDNQAKVDGRGDDDYVVHADEELDSTALEGTRPIAIGMFRATGFDRFYLE